jgi:hypothetical protein
MDGNKSNVSGSTHKGGRGSTPGSRVFRWIKGLWEKRPVEPSFRLVRMKRVPTVMHMYFELDKKTATPHTDPSPNPLEGLHDTDRGSREYCSVYRPPTAGPPRYEVVSNLPQTLRCYVAYQPGAGSILQPAVSNSSECSEAEGNLSAINAEAGNTVPDCVHGRLGRGLVDEGFANPEFAKDNSSRMALCRGTAPKHAALPNVEQRSQVTYRRSPDAMNMEHQDSARCSRPLVVVKPPKPMASDEEKELDERDMLPSRQQRHVGVGLPEIATLLEEHTVMRPAPPSAPPAPRLRRKPGYRLLRRAAMEMDEGVAWGTPLLSRLTKPNAVVPQTTLSLSDLPDQLLTEHYSH